MGESIKVLCVGDSLTYGAGSTPGNTYPEAMQRYLGGCFHCVQVISDGKPGYSTKNFREYIRSHESSPEAEGARFAAYREYDAVVILLGCNDCRWDNWVETHESMECLSDIVAYFKPYVHGDQGRVLLCSTLPLANPMPKDILGGQHPWKQDKVENEMNPGIKALAEREGARFINLYSAFKSGLDKGLELYDGIHPFDLGYRLIAETVGRAIINGV